MPRDPAEGGLVDPVAGLGDDELRSRLRDLLAPTGEVESEGDDCAPSGESERYLGLLDHSLGHLDAAVEHLRAAEREYEAAATPAHLARVRFELAGVLIARDVDDDRDEASRLIGQALTVAEAISDRYVAQELANIGAELTTIGERERHELRWPTRG